MWALTTRLICLVLLALSVLSTTACQGRQSDGVQSLSGWWAFQPGDDPRWADPQFDDRAWPRLRVPGSWGRQGYQDVYGIAWYRTRVTISTPANQPLGLTIGKVNAAYELFVDGVKVGGVGQLPPHAREEYDRHATVVLPPSSRAVVTIALRVWRPAGRHAGAAGPIGGPFEIGPLITLIERNRTSEVDQLILFGVFIVAACYVFGLWLLRPQASEYGWFAAAALIAALYGFCLTQWKYALFSDFLFMKKAEHFLLYLAAIALLEFLWAFLGRRKSRWLRLSELLFGAGAVTVVVTPGLEVTLWLLPLSASCRRRHGVRVPGGGWIRDVQRQP